MANIDINALNKLNAAFNYAQQIKNNPEARGGSTVVRLQGGDAITCDYSTADAPRGLFNRAERHQDQKDLNDATRAVFRQAVIDIFGTSINDVPEKVQSEMILSDYGKGKPLTARRILAVNKAINAELKKFAKPFGFTGGAAPTIISLVAKDSGLTNIANPVETFQSRVNRHAKASVTTLIAAQMSKNKSYDTFSVDVARGMGVTLGGKKVKTRDPAAARDKIVQFLTGNKRATFETANQATQRKVGVLMSLMHQGSFGIAMCAVGNGFDPEDNTTRFIGVEGTAMGGNQTNAFSVTMDRHGNVTIKGTAKFTRHTSLLATDGRRNNLSKATDNDGSYIKYDVEIKISAQDMNKFAEADWTQCDANEATRLEESHVADRFQKAADAIDEGYKFTGSVNATMKANINALYDMQTIYNRNNPVN